MHSGVRHDTSDGSRIAAEKAQNAFGAPDGFHRVPDGAAVTAPTVHLGNLHENFGAVKRGDSGFGDGAGDGTGEKGFDGGIRNLRGVGWTRGGSGHCRMERMETRKWRDEDGNEAETFTDRSGSNNGETLPLSRVVLRRTLINNKGRKAGKQ